MLFFHDSSVASLNFISVFEPGHSAPCVVRRASAPPGVRQCVDPVRSMRKRSEVAEEGAKLPMELEMLLYAHGEVHGLSACHRLITMIVGGRVGVAE